MTSLILRAATRFMLPLLLLFSVFLLLRGHNQPGGGFTGGLVGASAFILYALSFDVESARHALGLDPRQIIGVGLLTAALSGSIGMIAGLPFLTGLWADLPVPGWGKIAVGTPVFFDIGVYLVVIGVTLSIMLPLAEE